MNYSYYARDRFSDFHHLLLSCPTLRFSRALEAAKPNSTSMKLFTSRERQEPFTKSRLHKLRRNKYANFYSLSRYFSFTFLKDGLKRSDAARSTTGLRFSSTSGEIICSRVSPSGDREPDIRKLNRDRLCRSCRSHNSRSHNAEVFARRAISRKFTTLLKRAIDTGIRSYAQRPE